MALLAVVPLALCPLMPPQGGRLLLRLGVQGDAPADLSMPPPVLVSVAVVGWRREVRSGPWGRRSSLSSPQPWQNKWDWPVRRRPNSQAHQVARAADNRICHSILPPPLLLVDPAALPFAPSNIAA